MVCCGERAGAGGRARVPPTGVALYPAYAPAWINSVRRPTAQAVYAAARAAPRRTILRRSHRASALSQSMGVEQR
jgi:hypothetical protein